MKKLLILAAVIVAGVAANAATIKWSAGNLYASNGKDKFTGDVNLYAYLATADASTATIVSTVKASATGAIAATTFTDDSLVGGNDYTFFISFVDNGKQFTSATKTAAAYATQSQTIAFGNMQSATQNTSNWQVVPEPTSGLMLLLGVAGLALKRKRA